MAGLTRDLKFALRMLRRTPVFSAVATILLATAIGAATATFSLYSHLELKPVPGLRNSVDLVSIGFARQGDEWLPMNIAQFKQISERLSTVDNTVAIGFTDRISVALPNENSTDILVTGVSAHFFSDLGISLIAGTDLDSASADPLAKNIVISERLWRNQYGRSPSALGSAVLIEGTSYTVVGVVGGGFEGLRRGVTEHGWIPIEAQIEDRGAGAPPGLTGDARRQLARVFPRLHLYATLSDGVTLATLRQELNTILPRMRDNWLGASSADLMTLEALSGANASPRTHMTLVRQTELLSAAAILILVVASLNLSSFFIARGSRRTNELRTRLALGASRRAVARQLFVESAVVVSIGTVLGAILHIGLKSVLLRVPPFVEANPKLFDGGGDWRVAAFVLAAATVVAFIAGLLPAVRVATQPGLALRNTSAGLGRSTTQPLLIIQVFVATMAVLAGVLFVGELNRLGKISLGFEPARLTIAELGYDPGSSRAARRSATEADAATMQADLGTRLSGLPGLEGHAVGLYMPFTGRALKADTVIIVGATEQNPPSSRRSYRNHVSSGFFKTLGIPIILGRPFDETQFGEIVVSKSLALQLWNRENVIGAQISPAPPSLDILASGGDVQIGRRQTGSPQEIFTVVGVADDARYDPYVADPPMYYQPIGGALISGTFALRGDVNPRIVRPVLDEFVRDRMSPLIVDRITPMVGLVRQSISGERARTRLAIGCAVIALVLTIVGLYSAMHHMIETQRNELAVRKAVGASNSALALIVLKWTASIVVSGILAALVSALVFGDLIGKLLFGVDVGDVQAWGITLVVILLTGVAAAWIPARNAGRVDPAVALRYE